MGAALPSRTRSVSDGRRTLWRPTALVRSLTLAVLSWGSGRLRSRYCLGEALAVLLRRPKGPTIPFSAPEHPRILSCTRGRRGVTNLGGTFDSRRIVAA
jgi:hypothetical protein